MKPNCACGKPLHYTNEDLRQSMDELVSVLGETVIVRVSGRAWRVPRHYIALHGLSSDELPMLADQYHFEEITHQGN